jgi:hypothetical protein
VCSVELLCRPALAVPPVTGKKSRPVPETYQLPSAGRSSVHGAQLCREELSSSCRLSLSIYLRVPNPTPYTSCRSFGRERVYEVVPTRLKAEFLRSMTSRAALPSTFGSVALWRSGGRAASKAAKP